jgi:uncharacterized membrane protein YgdD (TMEM256/DUF423 family)
LTYKKIIATAALLGAIAVILGAFGAHLLKESLNVTQLSSYKTGNTYQFYHSLLLILIGIMYKFEASKLLRYSFWTCVSGILCFSGSLYILSCKDLIGLESTAIIGPITPLGGLLLATAWILLAINFFKKTDEQL